MVDPDVPAIGTASTCRWCKEPIMLGTWLGHLDWWAAKPGVGMMCKNWRAPEHQNPEVSFGGQHEPAESAPYVPDGDT